MKKLSFLILLLFASTCFGAETFKTKFNPFTSKLDYVHNIFGTITGEIVVATTYVSAPIVYANGVSVTGGGGGSQTPWTSNIDGVGYNLTTTGTVTGTVVTATSQLRANSALRIGGDAGVSATAAAGKLTLAGIGNTNNENLTLDFENSANVVVLGTTTGVTFMNFPFSINVLDDVFIYWGSGSDSKIDWETTGNDNLQLGLACGAATDSGYFSIMEYADIGNANRSPLATSANPILRIYSAYEPSATDYGEFYHDGTNFNIGLGEGLLAVGGSVTSTGTVTGVVVVATDYMSGRYAPRVVSGIVVAAPAINTNTTDIFTLTGQPTNITSFTTNLTGSPKNGQKLIIKITDSGVARTIAWGASFKSVSPLPTTTVISKELWIGLFYDASDNLWHCLTSAQE